MRLVLSLAALLLFVTSASAADKPNVLFIAIDDLNDWVGPLGGHPQVKTPHIDALAARGTTFTNAHCQSPLCNPSRTSLLTGLRPTHHRRLRARPVVPHLGEVEGPRDASSSGSAKHGYTTLTGGKIFHDGYPPKADRRTAARRWTCGAATAASHRGRR